MEALTTASQFILALAILVTLHELGHFLAARAFGIKVEKFYLFFDAWGFKLFSFKKGDTEYGIGWLPLGGYVKIAGMVDESLDTKQLKSEPEPWEFRSKPAWQRLIVMVGGVVVNLILGIVIYISLTYSQGDSYIPNEIINKNGGIYASPAAQKLGFKTGDHVVSLNGKPVVDLMSEFGNPDFLMANKKSIVVNRNGNDTIIELPKDLENHLSLKSEVPFFAPRLTFVAKTIVGGSNAAKGGLANGDKIDSLNGHAVYSFFEFKDDLLANAGKAIQLAVTNTKGEHKHLKVMVTSDGTIGFQPEITRVKNWEKHIDFTFGQSVSMGVEKSFSLITANAKGLGKVFSGSVNAKNSLAGPIGIAQLYGSHWDWINFWALTAMLSLALAFMNILPIPALDGGHVMFLLYEMITRKPISERVLYIGQIIGMVILFSLIAFIFWVDIARLLGL